MVKVKICGITNLEDALASIGAGCDALGFVFYKKSPRYINPQEAAKIIRGLPQGILKIGVFVNSRASAIKDIAKLCNLDILQFHGSESPEFCQRFKSYKIIKAFRINPVRNTKQIKNSIIVSNGVKDKIDLAKILKYKTFAYLFDTFVKSKPGGTGRKFNWELLKFLDKIKQPVFLSGGLDAGNVTAAIKLARPDWVDVSSSVEAGPGKKDAKKVKEFIQAVRKI